MHSLRALLLSLPLLAHASPVRFTPDNGAENNDNGIESVFEQQIYPHDPSDQSILDLEPEDMPSWPTTHLLARRLLGLSKTGILSTVYPASESGNDKSLSGVPIGLPDYFVDCASNSSSSNSELAALLGQGNPLILALNVATTVRNAKAGSNVSLSIDWWHDDPQSSDPSVSLAGLPRLSLLGTLEALDSGIPDSVHKEIEACYLASHSDAVEWLPGHAGSVHSGYWARLVVQQAYWVGGFGDRARIGWLDMESWRSISKEGRDGKDGWADVRLPGEK